MAIHAIDTHQIIDICRQNDVAMVGIFGSAARVMLPIRAILICWSVLQNGRGSLRLSVWNAS